MEPAMRVMMIVKATAASEARVLPTTEQLTEMGNYNQQLIDAGIMIAGEGLVGSSKGKRVTFSAAGAKVTDGPFAETKELVSGFWIIQVKDMDEAVAWASRIPFRDGETVELRRVVTAEDFGEAFTPELQEKEEAMRVAGEEIAARSKA
jgi:hypothetical protein